jgi:BRCT domain type II-containing protein
MAFKMAAKSPLMKQLTKPQEKLPEGLRNIIEAEPESPAKNMNKGYGTPSPMKAEMALSIEDSNYKKEMKAAKSPAKMKAAKSPAKKSKSKVEQDYARNAIADYKRGDKKAAGYEKKKALEVAAGEGK